MTKDYDFTTGRYGKYTNDQLKKAQIPANKIRCEICKKTKDSSGYSNATIARVKSAILAKSVLPNVRCIQCSGYAPKELKCCACKQVKGLESFAKTYRKTPDDAWCWKCAEERNNLDLDEIGAIPTNVDSDSDPEYDEDDGDVSDDDDGALRNITFTGTSQASSAVPSSRASDVNTETDSSYTMAYAPSSTGTASTIGGPGSAAAYLNRGTSRAPSQASAASRGASIDQTALRNVSDYGTYGIRSNAARVPIAKSKNRFPKVPAFIPAKNRNQGPPSDDDDAPVLSDDDDDDDDDDY